MVKTQYSLSNDKIKNQQPVSLLHNALKESVELKTQLGPELAAQWLILVVANTEM